MVLAEIITWRLLWETVGLLLLLSWTWSTTRWLWWRPRQLERALRAQGLNGNPYSVLNGDLKRAARLTKDALSRPISPASHRITARISPLEHEAITQHGKFSFTWRGPTPSVNIVEPELVQEVLSNKFGHFAKQKIDPIVRTIVTGLLSYEGDKWLKHRGIINPAFNVKNLKLMLPAFSACCDELIGRWTKIAGSGGCREFDVWPEFQSFTGDVISRAAFGSSYAEGNRIFELQTEQVELLHQVLQTIYAYIPGYRFLPTPQNTRRNKIEREIRALLRGIVEKREKALKRGEASSDLLGLLLESNAQVSEKNETKNTGLTIGDVIEECKLFYFAGQETTSVLLTWTMVLLSMHPIWQDRAREEVLQVFGKNKPDIDGLSCLKTVTCILNEVLRLYPPLSGVNRRTRTTTKLGGITFPPGVILHMPAVFTHHDPEIWGEDAEEFNPDRFAEGVSVASKGQLALFPFGWGPYNCIGQTFALLEAKMALSMILQNFKLELSPHYVHAPFKIFTLRPQHGAKILLTKI